jgi:hypothetical protein
VNRNEDAPEEEKDQRDEAWQYGNAEHDHEHKDGYQIQQNEENPDEHTSLLLNRMAQVESHMYRVGAQE